MKRSVFQPPAPPPKKNVFLLQQDSVFWGFGVPGGCKSILIAKTLHISYITELFGLMDFFLNFEAGFIKIDDFDVTLKKILI